MADFKTAVLLTLQNEGGYTNNPADPGGATNMGIEQSEVPDIDIKTLTQDQAIKIYADRYWKQNYSQIEDQSIANKLFDMGVLFGVGTAVIMLQSVLGLTVDGIFGPFSLAEVNQVNPASFLQIYKALFVQRVIQIGAKKPAEQIFVSGWIHRINS